jgi:3-hydroxyisobutyrate dehydrogenase-like beta-hydroxyacid dehydrogenase
MAQGPTPQIAWIGLGNMGRGMCKNLVEKGNLSQPLIIYNRTQQRAEDLSAKLGSGKTIVASSIEKAVKPADFIFTCLGDDGAVKDTIEIALAISGGVRGKLFVDCSTVHPDTTNELAQRITGEGAQFVACPGKSFRRMDFQEPN